MKRVRQQQGQKPAQIPLTVALQGNKETRSAASKTNHDFAGPTVTVVSDGRIT